MSLRRKPRRPAREEKKAGLPAIVTLTLNPALDVTAAAEHVRPTDKIRCTEPRFDPGGGGINVARVAQRLGAEVAAIFPSGGATGESLESLLAREGVTAVAVRMAPRTRESIVIDERATGLQYRFVFPGPVLPPDVLDGLVERVSDALGAGAYLVVSGSLPPELDVSFLERLRALCDAKGARMLVDTSGKHLRSPAVRGAYLLKPNVEELETAMGKKLESDDAQIEAARLLLAEGGIEIMVVSRGDKGALLVTAREQEIIPAIAVPVCSAVGAGDSMMAAIAVGLARALPLREAVRFGVAAGAAALMTPGTELARREDIERLYESGG